MTNDNALQPILDTHLHLICRNRFDYSWTQGIAPLEDYNFTLKDYWSLANDQGVAQAIFMETGVDDAFWKEEGRFALELMKEPENNLAGVIASCRPENNDVDFDSWLEETQRQQVLGYRRILHVEPDELSGSDQFIRNVRKIGSCNKTFDLCFLERQLPSAFALARNCDNTQMMLNHCGIPDIVSGEFEFWKKQIAQLASLCHVACKISGLVAYFTERRVSAETLRPYIEHCIDSFGWDRLVWGSDWPVCNTANGISHWVSLFRELLSRESKETQQRVYMDNAKKLYGLAADKSS